MLESFAAWLGHTPLNAFVAGQAWVVPLVQTIHILAIALVMGSIAIVHLRVLGLIERGQSVGALAARFVPPSVGAIVILALTCLLYTSPPAIVGAMRHGGRQAPSRRRPELRLDAQSIDQAARFAGVGDDQTLQMIRPAAAAMKRA